jgi:hypothetical protein
MLVLAIILYCNKPFFGERNDHPAKPETESVNSISNNIEIVQPSVSQSNEREEG